MNWYLVKLVYRIVVAKLETPAQFEEQLRLVSAIDDAAVVDKANALGLADQFNLVNDRQQLLQWKFIAVTEVIKISDWIDGAEVYSVHTEVQNAAGYTRLANDKAALLQQSTSTMVNF